MKVSIARSELLDSLSIVGKGMSARSTLPILSGVLFSVEEAQITLQATDLEVSVKHSAPALVEDPGQVVSSRANCSPTSSGVFRKPRSSWRQTGNPCTFAANSPRSQSRHSGQLTSPGFRRSRSRRRYPSTQRPYPRWSAMYPRRSAEMKREQSSQASFSWLRALL